MTATIGWPNAFGVGWLTRHAALRGYWDGNRGRGSVVWLDRIENRYGRWRWASPCSERDHEDVGVRTPREYLREGVDLLAESAEATAAEVRDSADALRGWQDESGQDTGQDEDAVTAVETDGEAKAEATDLWKAAWYWATGLSVFTLSPSLRPSEDEDDQGRAPAPNGSPLPSDAPSRWRYVGTAQVHEFPAHITEGATVLTRAGDSIGGSIIKSHAFQQPGKPRG